MTPGPASSMVTLLPRKRPTPIAPPIAIIVSCREFNRRCSPSGSAVGVVVLASGCRAEVVEDLSKTAPDLVIQILQFRLIVGDTPQHINELVYLVDGVVVDERRPNG